MTSYCNRISIHPCNDIVLQSYIDATMQYMKDFECVCFMVLYEITGQYMWSNKKRESEY